MKHKNTMLSRKCQIEWLISHCKGNNILVIDTADLELERAFIHGTGIELERPLWLDRIRGCAQKMGLKPTRMYNWDGGHGSGIPRYSVSYS